MDSTYSTKANQRKCHGMMDFINLCLWIHSLLSYTLSLGSQKADLYRLGNQTYRIILSHWVWPVGGQRRKEGKIGKVIPHMLWK